VAQLAQAAFLAQDETEVRWDFHLGEIELNSLELYLIPSLFVCPRVPLKGESVFSSLISKIKSFNGDFIYTFIKIMWIMFVLQCIYRILVIIFNTQGHSCKSQLLRL